MYYVAFFVIAFKLLTPMLDSMPDYMWIIGGLAFGYQMIRDQVNGDKK